MNPAAGEDDEEICKIYLYDSSGASLPVSL